MTKTERALQAFPFEREGKKKVRVTNYSRHNMSCDCIITLWTIDVTVTGEIANSASSMMDFSLIAAHDNGERPFLLNFQGL